MIGILRRHCEEIIGILDLTSSDETPKPMYCWTVIGGVPATYVAYITISEDMKILYQAYAESSGRSTYRKASLYFVQDDVLSLVQDAYVDGTKFVLDLEDLRTVRIPILPEVSA